ncbi:MAG TPA: ABC transporter permease [Candidatus Nanoarchaeia archaeon]|nr:ABC transporter permease [Candidatus Nanoarchaeia archaeon]
MNLTGFLTLTERECRRFLRVWQQTIIPPVITSLLFILIFGYSLGSQISHIAGVSYLEFIIPGLLMMGMIMSAYMNTVSSLYISKFQGNMQELLVAPLSYWEIIFALTIAAVLRAVLVGLSILAVSLLFTGVSVHSLPVLTYFMLLVSLLFSFAGIATGLWASNFDQMNIFSTFVITPLTYLGGVFYSLAMLPVFWQNVAKFNPVLYMVDGFRYGFLGRSDISLWISMLLVFVLALFFFALCVHLFRKGYKLRT